MIAFQRSGGSLKYRKLSTEYYSPEVSQYDERSPAYLYLDGHDTQ